MGGGVGLVAGLVALWPVLTRRGFSLSYDMVFVPNPSIGPSALGLDGSVPRAVPTDAVVALMSQAVPADLVQHALLLGFFVLGGSGVARWLSSWPGAAAAALTFVWNPYVVERLVIGHWAFLLGLAVLPWAARSAARARLGEDRALLATGGWVVVGSLAGSTSGVLVAATALVVACWPGPEARPGAVRRGAALGLVAAAANAPWIVSALASPGGGLSDAGGVAAFAARADTPFGLVPSLATLGGIWNPAVWPSERGSAIPVLLVLCVVVGAIVGGGRRLLAAEGGGGRGLCAAAAGAWVVAVLGGFAPGRAALRWLVVEVPGGGLLRDGQKFLAPFVLVVALALGLTVERILDAGTLRELGPGVARAAAVALVAVPALLLPSLAFGAGGRLESVAYPTEWVDVQQLLDEAPAGDAASFPWTYYRRFGWNADRVVLDPVPRLLGRPVLANDALPLKDMTIAGENPRAARVSEAVDAVGPLTSALMAEGVRYVLVHRPTAGSEAVVARFPGATELHRGPEFVVLDLGPAAPPTDRLPGWGVTGWWLLLAVVAGWVTLAAMRPGAQTGLLTSGRRHGN